jgi:hypothetical protein
MIHFFPISGVWLQETGNYKKEIGGFQEPGSNG